MPTETLGATLRAARVAAERTVDDVAASSGISAVQLRKIERDDAVPTARTLFRVLRILGIRADEIADLFAAEEEREVDILIADKLEKCGGARALGLRGEPYMPTLNAKRAYLEYLGKIQSCDE